MFLAILVSPTPQEVEVGGLGHCQEGRGNGGMASERASWWILVY